MTLFRTGCSIERRAAESPFSHSYYRFILGHPKLPTTRRPGLFHRTFDSGIDGISKQSGKMVNLISRNSTIVDEFFRLEFFENGGFGGKMFTIWSLVMVRNQLPAQAVNMCTTEKVKTIGKKPRPPWISNEPRETMDSLETEEKKKDSDRQKFDHFGSPSIDRKLVL
ncbi:hypothetical protein WN51_02765 [Melipona quadrifasciata]|uniref:Uncharacterized protein n=1 Tax=Melipona quadrifasciata TaxID=166423 RepID=A0A0M9AB17_9HYME|nr:hypothetical protein WN51_02765 [Melipona quadrifasciata]